MTAGDLFPCRGRIAAAALWVYGGAAAGQEPVVSLGERFDPALVERDEPLAQPIPTAVDQVAFTATIAAADWRASGPGRWSVPWPFEGSDLPLVSEAQPVLWSPDRTVEVATFVSPKEVPPEGGCWVERGRLVLAPGGASPPPPGTRVLCALVSRGRRRVPAHPDLAPRFRVHVGPYTTDGFALGCGESVAFELTGSGPCTLRFASSCVGRAGAAGAATCIVELDGRPVARFDQPIEPAAMPQARTVSVPLEDGVQSRLRFRVRGPPALFVVHAPRLVPAGAPPGSGRDAILFVSDTLRADALEDERLAAWTPRLRAFAAESAVQRAWSPANFTLPAVSSMLLGVFPTQHGATDFAARAPGSLPTLAEHLAARGWRTVAVTEGLFVSQRHGLARGFEWFEERDHEALETGLERVRQLLAAGDGRPTFLMFHTYKMHVPYAVSDATFDRCAGPLGLELRWPELEAALRTEMRRAAVRLGVAEDGRRDAHVLWALQLADEVTLAAVLDPPPDSPLESGAHAVDQLHRSYLACAVELDRAFGAVLDATAATGRETCVVFTGDHGESFGEHGLLFHGQGLYDEVLRVPLWIRAPGVAPGPRPAPASLVDVPATVTALLGLEPVPGWSGRALPDAAPRRTVFAVDSSGDVPRLAMTDGHYKVLFAVAADDTLEPHEFYDLVADPDERHDLAAESPAAAADFLAPCARLVPILLAPLAPDRDADLTPADLRRLHSLGYVDD